MLASLLYPYDDDAPSLIVGWLSELEQKECIRRYEVDGSTYLEIINWLKHQKIDRPSPSKIPAPAGTFASPREDSRALDADLVPSTSTSTSIDAAERGTDEVELFRRGKEVLGTSAGGIIRKLLAAKGENIPLARAAVETAATKQNPREYVGAIINKRDGPGDLRARGEAW
jgi:hypothetical protein